MLTATLIADPALDRLATDIVQDARDVLAGAAPRWLSDHACELDCAQGSDGLWSMLQKKRVDLVVQPSADRRKRVLLADMDSTMIQQECIDELAAAAGVGEHVAGITARAMNGELDFEDALRERVSLLAGLPVSIIGEVLESRITLMPGGVELVATMRAQGAYCALVSGGFTDFTGPIAARLGFHEDRANTLVQENGRLTGVPGDPILGQQAKVDALHDITDLLGVAPHDVIAVGDGANDLGMLLTAGAGVALHAKPSVAERARMRLNFADLHGVLYVQGYHRDEFVTR